MILSVTSVIFHVTQRIILTFDLLFYGNKLIMVNEGRKYLSDILKITGFTLMTPVAKLYLELNDMDFSSLDKKFFILFSISAMLFCSGIMTLYKGYKISEEK